MIYIFGRGHLGSALADYFSENGRDMMVFGRNCWPDKFREEDTIINCAGSWNRGEDVRGMIRDNLDFPMTLKDKSNGANFIHISSWVEEVDPTTVYARTKGLATDYLKEKGAHICMTCAIWGGPYESPKKFMMSFLRAMAKGSHYHIYYPFLRRDHVHIDTFCQAVEDLVNTRDYKMRYFATGRMRSFYEIYKLVQDVSGIPWMEVELHDDVSTKINHDWPVENPEFEDTFREDVRKEWKRLCE